jgi:hypothetical protein
MACGVVSPASASASEFEEVTGSEQSLSSHAAYMGTFMEAQDRSPLAGNVCIPNSTKYSTSSVTKRGRVTSWSKHVKNDSTKESFTWSSSRSVSVRATANVGGSLTASVAIKKIAEVALGLDASFGLEGSLATTSSFSRSVTFSAPGAWVIWRGVYTGAGTVTKRTCNSVGNAAYVSKGNAFTYGKASVTGLTNCAKSVSDLVAIDAKRRCG